MTAEEALIRIRRTAAKKETIYTTFVVSPDRKLKGTLHLEDLILASPRPRCRSSWTISLSSWRPPPTRRTPPRPCRSTTFNPFPW